MVGIDLTRFCQLASAVLFQHRGWRECDAEEKERDDLTKITKRCGFETRRPSLDPAPGPQAGMEFAPCPFRSGDRGPGPSGIYENRLLRASAAASRRVVCWHSGRQRLQVHLVRDESSTFGTRTRARL